MIIRVPDGYTREEVVALIQCGRSTIKKRSNQKNLKNSIRMRKLGKLMIDQLYEEGEAGND